MSHHILQWNCRGIKPNYNEILLLLNKHKPSVFCLQETFLQSNDNITFKNYSIYNHIFENADRACGGSSIIVDNKYPHRQIDLDLNFQATAVVVTLHRPICICSIYIPPSYQFTIEELYELISQLPSPFLILGDFNSHNKLWGNTDTDNKGDIVELFLNEYDICLLNGKDPRYLSPSTGKYSSLDLSLSHPAIFLDYSWQVLDDLCGSDHFPVMLSYETTNDDRPAPRYKFNKADWETFRLQCSVRLNQFNFPE